MSRSHAGDVCELIAAHSEAAIVVVETQRQLELYLAHAAQLPLLKAIVMYLPPLPPILRYCACLADAILRARIRSAAPAWDRQRSIDRRYGEKPSAAVSSSAAIPVVTWDEMLTFANDVTEADVRWHD